MASRNVRLKIIGFITLIFVLMFNIGPETDRALAYKKQANIPPLLLNSGLTSVNEAEVQVVFWFEEQNNGVDSSFINEQILSQPGWSWEIKGQGLLGHEPKQGTEAIQALTITGHRYINASEEGNILNWFRQIRKKVELQEGEAYLDERVKAEIDAEAYLRQNNFEIRQKALSGKTTSLAAWQEGFLPGVKAGQDLINMQLLSRNTSLGATTVLAIPVLLEEF